MSDQPSRTSTPHQRPKHNAEQIQAPCTAYRYNEGNDIGVTFLRKRILLKNRKTAGIDGVLVEQLKNRCCVCLGVTEGAYW